MSDPEVERAAGYLATQALLLLGGGTLAAAISITGFGSAVGHEPSVGSVTAEASDGFASFSLFLRL